MFKLNFSFISICLIILLVNYCSAAPDLMHNKYGTLGGEAYGGVGGLGMGGGLGGVHGIGGGFGEDCRTEATIRMQRCIEDYEDSSDMFFRRMNYFGRASKDMCCRMYKIRRCLRKSLYELNGCRDIVDAIVASRLNNAMCDGYIETDCYLPIWAIILIVIFSILFIGCLVAGIVYLLRKRQTTT